MLEDISNQDLILQQSLFTIWTIGFVIHLVQVYYNLDYWTHHSFGSKLFQPGQPFCITSSCFWSFAKIFTIWTIGLIIHLVLNYFNQVNLFALQVPVFGHLPKYLQFGLLDSSFI